MGSTGTIAGIPLNYMFKDYNAAVAEADRIVGGMAQLDPKVATLAQNANLAAARTSISLPPSPPVSLSNTVQLAPVKAQPSPQLITKAVSIKTQTTAPIKAQTSTPEPVTTSSSKPAPAVNKPAPPAPKKQEILQTLHGVVKTLIGKIQQAESQSSSVTQKTDDESSKPSINRRKGRKAKAHKRGKAVQAHHKVTKQKSHKK